MSFFATKSRIAVARFINLPGNGTGTPGDDDQTDPTIYNYWIALFGDDTEIQTYGARGKVFYDPAEHNLYYFYLDSDFKFGSFDTINFNPRWARRNYYQPYPLPPGEELNQYEEVFNFKMTDSYDFYFTGYKNDAPADLPSSFGREMAFLSKFDSNGNPLWEVRDSKLDTLNFDEADYVGFGNNNSLYGDLSIDSLGNIFVVGTHRYLHSFTPFITYNGLTLAKYSPNGSLIFQANYLSPNPAGIPYGIPKLTIMDNTDHFYMSTSLGYSFGSPIIVSRISTNGTIVWSKTIGGFFFEITKIIGSENGTLAFFGYSEVGVMDNDGDMVWSGVIYDGYIEDIAFDSEYNVYAVGRTDDDHRNVVYKVSSSSALVWQINILSSGGFAFTVESISVDSNDDLYIYGYYEPEQYTSYEQVIIKMPNTGIFSGTYTVGALTIEFQQVIDTSENYDTSSFTISDYTIPLTPSPYVIDEINTPHVTEPVTDTIEYVGINVP